MDVVIRLGLCNRTYGGTRQLRSAAIREDHRVICMHVALEEREVASVRPSSKD